MFFEFCKSSPSTSVRSTATATATPRCATAESAGARMSHAGVPVVAPHLGFGTTANAAEGTAIATRILPFKTLAAEALPRLSP